jgi:DNA-binding response OmpR family regulator
VQVLVVDFEEAEARALATLFEQSGFHPLVASWHEAVVDGGDAVEAISLGPLAPLKERIARCRELRDHGFVGAILAACPSASEGEALLDAGADDFVTAPLEEIEFVARLRASTRRATARSRLRWGALELDRVGRVARVRGREVPLTARECEVLVSLIEAGGRVVSRATLAARIWQREGDPGSNVVEVHLSRLRDKLGRDAAVIETVRRAGYRLRR